MHKKETIQLLAEELRIYEGRSYAELVQRIGENLVVERKGSNGASYQVEIQILWDSKPDGAIRVIASIDDGGWRAFLPLTDSILKTPGE